MNVKLSHGGGKEIYTFGVIPAGMEVVLTPTQYAEFEETFSGSYTVSQTNLDSTYTGEVSAPTPMPEPLPPRVHKKK